MAGRKRSRNPIAQLHGGERPHQCEKQRGNIAPRELSMTESLRFKLCGAKCKSRDNFAGQVWIRLECKPSQSSDRSIGPVQVLLACGAREQMLAERLLFLTGDFAC
jgi:hypothetical protein